MIGNDIVDLRASRQESNWQRKGWIQKIFSVREQALIHHSKDKESTVWLLWSMKEAAYKIFNRMNHKMFYSPAAFHCSVTQIQNNLVTGNVLYRESNYHTKSILCHDYIHTIAKDEIVNSKSSATIIGAVTKPIQLPANFTLNKDSFGIPYLLDINTGKARDASLSHHGDYIALVY